VTEVSVCLSVCLSVCVADAVEECVSVLPEQVSALEEFIPIRQTSVTLMRATVSVPAAEYNLLHLLLPVLLGHKVQTTHTLSSYTCLAGVCVCYCLCVSARSRLRRRLSLSSSCCVLCLHCSCSLSASRLNIQCQCMKKK